MASRWVDFSVVCVREICWILLSMILVQKKGVEKDISFLFSRHRGCRGPCPTLQFREGSGEGARCPSGPGSVGTHPHPYPPTNWET